MRLGNMFFLYSGMGDKLQGAIIKTNDEKVVLASGANKPVDCCWGGLKLFENINFVIFGLCIPPQDLLVITYTERIAKKKRAFLT